MSYKLDVFTGDVGGAGTDANITVTLYGDRNRTQDVTINPLISGNAFERGAQDTVELPVSDVGDIEKVDIRHDDAWAGSGWKLDRLVVTRHATGQQFNFPCYRWLAKDEDDGAIGRVLTVEGGPWIPQEGWGQRESVAVGEELLFILNNWEGKDPVTRRIDWSQTYTRGLNTEEGHEERFTSEVAAKIGGTIKGIELGVDAKQSFERAFSSKFGTTDTVTESYQISDEWTAGPEELLLVIRRYNQIYEYGVMKRNNLGIRYVCKRELLSNVVTVSNFLGDSMKAVYKPYLEKAGVDTSQIRWRG